MLAIYFLCVFRSATGRIDWLILFLTYSPSLEAAEMKMIKDKLQIDLWRIENYTSWKYPKAALK